MCVSHVIVVERIEVHSTSRCDTLGLPNIFVEKPKIRRGPQGVGWKKSDM